MSLILQSVWKTGKSVLLSKVQLALVQLLVEKGEGDDWRANRLTFLTVDWTLSGFSIGTSPVEPSNLMTLSLYTSGILFRSNVFQAARVHTLLHIVPMWAERDSEMMGSVWHRKSGGRLVRESNKYIAPHAHTLPWDRFTVNFLRFWNLASTMFELDLHTNVI